MIGIPCRALTVQAVYMIAVGGGIGLLEASTHLGRFTFNIPAELAKESLGSKMHRAARLSGHVNLVKLRARHRGAQNATLQAYAGTYGLSGRRRRSPCNI